MKPLLYDKTGTVKLGELTNCIECLVEEERNGLFEVSLIYPTNDTLFNSLEEENIIVCNANDTLLNQKFRIYMTRKLMSNKIEVFARHISFDLAYDYINSIDLENQSCEYALNTIFRNSQFSTHYKGYSDIINAQDYKISKVNCIEAIAGTQGSIIDTFGTGAEILRDNTNIHVLNKRGYDNEVSIEYAKNLTGFELEEDYTDLITRIIPFASYTDNETNEEILVEANAVDSDYISNYSHPYISYMDFSEKFEDEEIPTTSKLQELARKYFLDNECDKPKQNFKIEFVPLSKCVGYEGIQDNISLCDTVTIKDTRFNIDTKAKVIKTVFNVLKNKYESMELGEPRTTLGDIINSSSGGENGKQGPPGPQGPPGVDGSIGDFPNSLPSTPVLSANIYGFASIELNWTYENKVYYNYELYGSKTKNFIPNTFDLIHAGQTSSYLFQAKPNETWYFRVCAVNTHGERTPFSDQVIVNTTKIDNLENYFTDIAIGNAVVGSLTADYMSAGIIKGNWIDAKNLSVTDGNGKRTFDIDSFGNVNIQATDIKMIVNGESQDLIVRSEFEQTKDSFDFKFTQIGAYNLLYNGNPLPSNYKGWTPINTQFYTADETKLGIVPNDANSGGITSEIIDVTAKKELSFKGFVNSESNTKGYTIYVDGYLDREDNDANWRLELFRTSGGNNQNTEINQSFVVPNHIKYLRLVLVHNGIYDLNNQSYRILFFSKFQLVEGQNNFPNWSPCPDELYNASTHITPQGLTVYDGKINILNKNGNEMFWVDQTGRLSTDNIFIYGSDSTGNLNVSGTGNKGVGIRSLDGGDRYIDFTTVEFDTSFPNSVSTGKHVRLLARDGKLLLLPTTSLEIGSVNDTLKLQDVFLDADKMTVNGEIESTGLIHALGNVNVEGTTYATTCRVQSLAGYNNNDDWISVNSPMQCSGYTHLLNDLNVEGTNYNITARIRNLAGYSSNNETIVVHSPIEVRGGIIQPTSLTEAVSLLDLGEDVTALDKISQASIVNDKVFPIITNPDENILDNYVQLTEETVNLNISTSIALLWKAIQELKEKNDKLKEEINNLKGE